MSQIFGIIIFMCFLWGFGGLLIIPSFANKRQSEKLYRMYQDFVDNFGFSIIEDYLGYNRFPMIYGKYNGRKIFIRPVFEKVGRSLTGFGMEHKIPFDKKVTITIPEKNRTPFGYPVNVINLKNTTRNYEIHSIGKSNERILNEIFTKDVSNYFKVIDNKNPDNFCYVVLDSGIIILYIYSWEHKKDVLKNYLTDLMELVKKMEKSTTKLSDNLENYRFDEINTGMNIKKDFVTAMFIMLLIMGVTVLLFLGIIIINQGSFDIGGFILLNLGIYFILVGVTRIYTNNALKKLMKST
jgi:hypothetical protein